MNMVECCLSGDLRFFGKEFCKWRDELRNERSANLNLVETRGRESHR